MAINSRWVGSKLYLHSDWSVKSYPETGYCPHCGMAGGKHLVDNCRGDVAGLWRRLEALEETVRLLRQQVEGGDIHG